MKIHMHSRRQERFDLFLMAFLFLMIVGVRAVYAVPETTAVRVTDVTTSSFSVVWLTDVAADPSVEVYTDNAMQQKIAEGIQIAAMPTSSAVARSAKAKGIMKVTISGVQPITTYYVRTVTKDPSDPVSISYSPLQTVTTAASAALYQTANGLQTAFANDLVSFPVYTRPYESADQRLGDLILFENLSASSALSAFVGEGAVSPEGIIDINNLYGSAPGTNLQLAGNEKIIMTVYRSGGLSTLTHYRRMPQNTLQASVVQPYAGFFADFNLDGKVDEQDFLLLKAQYRTTQNDPFYNPDYDFVVDAAGRVDVREFGKFSKEYGRTDVQ